MGAVKSVLSKVGGFIKHTADAAVHDGEKAVSGVVHLAKEGAEDVVGTVEKIPGLKKVVKFAQKGVGDVTHVLGTVSNVVGKVAPFLGPEAAEFSKTLSTASGVANKINGVVNGSGRYGWHASGHFPSDEHSLGDLNLSDVGETLHILSEEFSRRNNGERPETVGITLRNNKGQMVGHMTAILKELPVPRSVMLAKRAFPDHAIHHKHASRMLRAKKE